MQSFGPKPKVLSSAGELLAKEAKSKPRGNGNGNGNGNDNDNGNDSGNGNGNDNGCHSLLSLFPTRDKKSTPEHSEPILRVTALSLMLTVAELISLKQKSIPTKVHLSNTTVQYESI